MKCSCVCIFPWLSGFFAMPAIAHLVRIIAGWEVTFKGASIPIKSSWYVFIIGGILAIIFGIIGCRMHSKEGAGVC